MKRAKKPDSTKREMPTVHLRPEEAAAAVRRAFPGPKKAQAPLRVAIEPTAFAALTQHAKESLDAEVCGVLVGNICQDEEGIFTHVTHALRGQGAAEGSTHVTFTQATWNTIHETMDKEHIGRAIVGWYHTHPGFGVEFSDMDIFIQRNFFNGPAQVALVMDPKNNAVALAMNAAEGIHYLDSFWLDGREHAASTPAPPPELGAERAAAGGVPAQELRTLEERIAQLTQAMDEMRSWIHWLLLSCGGLVCAGVVVFVATLIREQFRARVSPPELISHVPVPVKVGDKNVLLGVSITRWEVPPELNAMMLDLAREEAERQKAAEAEQGGDQAQASKEDAPGGSASAAKDAQALKGKPQPPAPAPPPVSQPQDKPKSP